MTRLIELLFKIIMVPIFFIREDITGVNFKEYWDHNNFK